jgi:hypothetical protein
VTTPPAQTASLQLSITVSASVGIAVTLTNPWANNQIMSEIT